MTRVRHRERTGTEVTGFIAKSRPGYGPHAETNQKRSQRSIDEVMMVKVQAIIREERLDAVIERLLLLGIRGLTISPVKGSSQHTAYRAIFRGGRSPVPFLSMLMIEWCGTRQEEEGVLRAIAQAAFTGKAGDGTIFTEPLEEAVRIRTGERGEQAI
jgi:nitrogen regulatory protein PII